MYHFTYPAKIADPHAARSRRRAGGGSAGKNCRKMNAWAVAVAAVKGVKRRNGADPPPSLTRLCQHVTGGSPDVTKLSPNCHQTVTNCHKMSPRCHEMSRGVTGCHGGVTAVATVTNCHQTVTNCHQTVTKLSPKCHQNVTICRQMSPSCHHLSLEITEHHGHCRCDITYSSQAGGL